ncbi:ead/Ea22-like family protein [Klebsiella michiganensis]|uniref:ead/Ea22-like family protein n=1 Tax=Klebsiella michiganensis TaxID=1134687 RepID=UPI0012B95BF2|nr:ead/Ea22-like family protein [Klebsiella michiganensis]
MTTKTDIAELTSEKLEEIRQRYRQTEVPKCHICGAEMTIQRMSASRITYGCAGAIYDETGCHYAEGRSLADDHYAESRITVVDVSDHDVLALVEALELKEEQRANWFQMAQKLGEDLDAAEKRNAELEREHENLRPVGVMSEKAYHRLENRESRFIALWPRPEIYLPRKRPDDGVIVYARTAFVAANKAEAE